MHRSRRWTLLLALLAGGCGRESTAQLIENLKSPDAETRIKAARGLADRKADAATVVPALTEALKDEHTDVRRCAAIGLGSFGPDARDAIPALQVAARDREPSVRRAVNTALRNIDPPAKKPGTP
jgi:HEAT repeat protein